MVQEMKGDSFFDEWTFWDQAGEYSAGKLSSFKLLTCWLCLRSNACEQNPSIFWRIGRETHLLTLYDSSISISTSHNSGFRFVVLSSPSGYLLLSLIDELNDLQSTT